MFILGTQKKCLLTLGAVLIIGVSTNFPSKDKLPKLVVFDLFGTLVQFGTMHHPYRKLLKWARENGRAVNADDARTILTSNLEIPELADSIGISAPLQLMQQISADIQDELSTIKLFDDVVPCFEMLEDLGVNIGICSNLAKPYGKALELLPQQYSYLVCMSYEVGFMKPEQQIYQWLLNQSGLNAGDCLFVGDTYLADYSGPTQIGMKALHLVRGEDDCAHQISSLLNIF